LPMMLVLIYNPVYKPHLSVRFLNVWFSSVFLWLAKLAKSYVYRWSFHIIWVRLLCTLLVCWQLVWLSVTHIQVNYLLECL